MTLPLDEIRALFPHTQNQGYFNHAAISPLSIPVKQAIDTYLAERHLTAIENYPQMLPRIAQLRERLSELVGVPPEQIALSPNTSSGLNMLATGLQWQAGDRILLNRLEFPSNIYPFLNLQQQGVIIDFVEPREHVLHLEDFSAAIQPQTRLLSVSWVQFLTGQQHDLAALGQLCQQQGLFFCVDGIQALGAASLDMNALGIDFLAAGGHKWLMGLEGQGFVAFSERLLQQVTPAQVGWLSVKNAWDMLDYQLELREDAARFEQGTFNSAGIVSLLTALEVFNRYPMNAITQHVKSLADYLIAELQALGLQVITPANPAEHLGIVTCLHPQADSLQKSLAAQQLHVSAREGRYFRVSPHFYNSHAELEQLLNALKRLL